MDTLGRQIDLRMGDPFFDQRCIISAGRSLDRDGNRKRSCHLSSNPWSLTARIRSGLALSQERKHLTVAFLTCIPCPSKRLTETTIGMQYTSLCNIVMLAFG